MTKKSRTKNSRRNSKKQYYFQKIISKLSVTLYLSIYSIYYFDVNILKRYLNLSDEILRALSVLIAYILSGYIINKDVKNYKIIKLTYIINFIVFIIVLLI
ncbi:hypothetical protein [Tepidibacter formicigenes]|jgi:hypothetical protein|uniref:Uncharacterized protein n=1 Tax=Tepidibacter formicigenes DSM 15518 TaxID=1123349 RepID=A0A1M6JF86_9FIRM|nr:hypothetical protein [Tepidibacter formicigenes]SHJ45334.1 hypothetical protein SAMN02744037_00107 [Tepidibacter formicigenes DSM 15518]